MPTEREMTLDEWVNKLPFCHSAQREYTQLLKDSEILNALKDHGVDNWDGYSAALKSLEVDESEMSHD